MSTKGELWSHIINDTNWISKEDKEAWASKLLEENTVFKNDSYESMLLWRTGVDSYLMAIQIFVCLERRFSKDEARDLKIWGERFNSKVMCRRISRRQPEEMVPPNKNKSNKFWMVWDAVAEVNGICLNKLLLIGPGFAIIVASSWNLVLIWSITEWISTGFTLKLVVSSILQRFL